MKFGAYLAFENAIEAVKYYEENYGATSKGHTPLSREHADMFGLAQDLDLATTTFNVSLNVFENDFAMSDRFGTPEFSDSVNMMIYIDEDEKEKLAVIREQVKNDKDATLLYDEVTPSYEMLRLKDKYGLIWSFMMFNLSEKIEVA